MEDKFEKVRRLRIEERRPIGEIQKELGLAKSTTWVYIRKVENTFLSEEEIKELRKEIGEKGRKKYDHSDVKKSSYNYLKRKIILLEEEVKIYKSNIVSVGHHKTVQKGIIGELLVRYQLARRGIQFFDPTEAMEIVDLLIPKQNNREHYLCQVKSYCDGHNGVRLQRTLRNDNSGHKFAGYSERDIDFFFIVNLNTEIVAVVPMRFIVENEIKNIGVSPGHNGWSFVDRYELLK